MTRCVRLSRRVRSLREKSGTELGAMFGAWAEVPEDFGAPKRRRLFFPLAGLLDVPLAGPLGGPRLSRDRAQVPRMAGWGGARRFRTDRRLLQSPRPA